MGREFDGTPGEELSWSRRRLVRQGRDALPFIYSMRTAGWIIGRRSENASYRGKGGSSNSLFNLSRSSPLLSSAPNRFSVTVAHLRVSSSSVIVYIEKLEARLQESAEQSQCHHQIVGAQKR